MIAGNHDSGYRIEQVEPLLEKYHAKAVGVIRWNDDKSLNTERLILPIYDAQKILWRGVWRCLFCALPKLQG
jgi:exonuclease SbcD